MTSTWIACLATLAALATLFGALAAWRCRAIAKDAQWAIGFQYPSPDGRYTAFLTSYEVRTFWGGFRGWYHLQVDDTSSGSTVYDRANAS